MKYTLKLLILTAVLLTAVLVIASPAYALSGPSPEGGIITEGVTEGDFPDPTVTLITLSSFVAEAGDGKVTVKWSTASELDNQGFNLWRATSAAGEPTKINNKLVSAKAESVGGAEYSLIDTKIKNGSTYYYKLEDIDNKGVSSWHGPVVAVPNFAIMTAPPAGAAEEAGAKAPGEAAPAPINERSLNAPYPVLPRDFKWTSPGSYNYQLQISADPSFPANEKKTLTLPGKAKWTEAKNLTTTAKQQAAIAKLAEEGKPVYVSVIGRDQRGNLNYAPVSAYSLPVPLYRRLALPAARLAIIALGALATVKLAALWRRRALNLLTPVGGQE